MAFNIRDDSYLLSSAVPFPASENIYYSKASDVKQMGTWKEMDVAAVSYLSEGLKLLDRFAHTLFTNAACKVGQVCVSGSNVILIGLSLTGGIWFKNVPLIIPAATLDVKEKSRSFPLTPALLRAAEPSTLITAKITDMTNPCFLPVQTCWFLSYKTTGFDNKDLLTDDTNVEALSTRGADYACWTQRLETFCSTDTEGNRNFENRYQAIIEYNTWPQRMQLSVVALSTKGSLVKL